MYPGTSLNQVEYVLGRISGGASFTVMGLVCDEFVLRRRRTGSGSHLRLLNFKFYSPPSPCFDPMFRNTALRHPLSRLSPVLLCRSLTTVPWELLNGASTCHPQRSLYLYSTHVHNPYRDNSEFLTIDWRTLFDSFACE